MTTSSTATAPALHRYEHERLVEGSVVDLLATRLTYGLAQKMGRKLFKAMYNMACEQDSTLRHVRLSRARLCYRWLYDNIDAIVDQLCAETGFGLDSEAITLLRDSVKAHPPVDQPRGRRR